MSARSAVLSLGPEGMRLVVGKRLRRKRKPLPVASYEGVERLVVATGGYLITRPVRSARIEYPMPTVGETNEREHWKRRHRRRRQQRALATLAARHCLVAALPCTIKLTRIAPRALDDDNLRGALKATRDGIADHLGIDDSDDRVTWEYGQLRAAEPRYQGVRIEVVA